MNKKFFISLAPLVAIMAFAMIPAAAQAAPHWYVNGSKLAPGCGTDEPGSCGVDVISWGTLTLTSAAGAVTCENIGAGDIENPVNEEEPGKDSADAFVPYDCTAEGCPPPNLEITVTAEGLPWPSIKEEPEAGVFRDKSTGIKVRVKCEILVGPEKGKTPLNVVFSGELSPKSKNGTGVGSKPSTSEFDTGSGALESEVGPGKTSGKLKTMGYAGQEIIADKNP